MVSERRNEIIKELKGLLLWVASEVYRCVLSSNIGLAKREYLFKKVWGGIEGDKNNLNGQNGCSGFLKSIVLC